MSKNFERGYSLHKQSQNPFMYEHEPDIDSSEPLDPERASYFQYLIGVMRRMIENFHIDIATEF